MAYIRHSFLRMYPWRRSDSVSVAPAVSGVDHQFDYWFGWLTPDVYYQPPYTAPNIAAPTALNSADYASDPAHGISTLQVRMLENIYPDTANLHATAQGWLRRRNIAYTIGPDAIETTGENLFRRGWAFWSDPTEEGCVFTARISDDGSGFEAGWGPGVQVIDLGGYLPAYEPILHGYKANLTACFDMAAKPILAWESAIDTISILRVNEGLQTFSGYSPMLSCNAAFVDPDFRFTNTDTIVWYLKDVGGYTGTWNYPQLLGPNTPDTGARQVDDARRSTAIYYRIQRENFLVEHKMCDLPFPIQHIDQSIYDGRMWDEDYDDGIYPEGAILRDPVDTKFKEIFTVVDGSGARHVIVSHAYYVKVYIKRSAEDDFSVNSSITSGSLFDVIVSNATVPTDGLTISPSVTGTLFDTIVPHVPVLEPFAIEPSVHGSLTTTVVADGPRTDTVTLSSSIASGNLVTTIVGTTPQVDTGFTLTPSVFGSIVTV